MAKSKARKEMAVMSAPVKPWVKYAKESTGPGQGQLRHKLLIPGYAGHLEPEELVYILDHLARDPALAAWWGIPRRWRRIPEEVIKRVALSGSEGDQAKNRRLTRPRQQSRAAA
jgi:hypothetical protein